jgi:hypothetical protein
VYNQNNTYPFVKMHCSWRINDTVALKKIFSLVDVSVFKTLSVGLGGSATGLHFEAAGVRSLMGQRSGNGGQTHTVGCSTLGITYTNIHTNRSKINKVKYI